MKHAPKKSLSIVAFLAEEKRRAAEPSPAMDRIEALVRQWPHGSRAEVFCWLWDNHRQVQVLLREHRTWEGIARFAVKDGMKGRWGEPPTASSIRHVWPRVCREKEEREVRAAARAAERQAKRGR